jgi:hypothetical protein
MTESRITMRLRPFEKLLTADNNALRSSGRIEGNVYVLKIGESAHRLPIVDTGSDEWGPYALVEESQTPIGSGFVLSIERNLEEPDLEAGLTFEPGCRIALTRPGQIDPMLLVGIDPMTVNVVAPPDASVSIRFNFAGTVEGWAMRAYPEEGQKVRPQ